jgi:hypothetical protein
VLVAVATKLDVRRDVVVEAVLNDVICVVVVVGVELAVGVVTTEFVVVVTVEFVVVTGVRVVVAVVVVVAGSATAGATPRPSAASGMASPNASTNAAPRGEGTRNDADIVPQLLSSPMAPSPQHPVFWPERLE